MPPAHSSEEQFVLHWGEMSSRWGINRSVAQIHALLYLSEEPLNAEQISERLSLARSNVSNSLRELQAWGIVRVVHQLGDRRDYFESVSDVWDMFLTILEQRKRREVDPTTEMLRECVAQHEAQGRDAFALARMRSLLELLEMLAAWYGQMRSLSPASQRRVLKMGRKLTKIVGDVRPIRKGRRS
ncbi:MAG: MarR family transcriptional regulator [Candidatus Latescibacterota bacterium]|nr:MAG: MarR family transcriptional regulator [Candidatus Latescibacterota bacterium]